MLESDDWGLCAWSPDAQAWRALAGLPAFRTAPGRRYGGSTLETADDVRQLAGVLAAFRGGDGLPPVIQANSVMAAPAFEHMHPPVFEFTELPLSESGGALSRWSRPGLTGAIDEAIEAGLWWAELHGLHHLPEHAWITALRGGTDDARRAHEQQSAICIAVEASGEYDRSEPRELRRQHIERAVSRFHARFGRLPTSLCPPDYRWDEHLEADAEALGITTLQGAAEQAGRRLTRLRRLLLRHRWPHRRGERFYMPPRIAFEPSAWGPRSGSRGVDVTLRAVRAAWDRGQPAVVSTHRLNYAHLEPERPVSGRAALREMVGRLAEAGAMFLTDAEIRQLQDRHWCMREIGSAGAILRCYGVSGAPVRFRVPRGVTSVSIRGERDAGDRLLRVERGEIRPDLNEGVTRIEWRR